MAWHSTWNDPPQPRRSGLTPPGVKILLIINVVAFVLDFLFKVKGPPGTPPMGVLTALGALRVTNAALIYPLVTYQFLHAGFFHIAINMLILWMLGRHIESRLGRRQFLYLYLLSGVLGGLLQVGFNILMTRWYGPAILHQPTVGASGAVMGILTAFAVLYPREELYVLVLFFFLPIQARWLALIYFMIESLAAYEAITTGVTGNVANAAHVGGMVLGFVWMQWGTRIAAAMRRRAPRPRAGPFEGTRERNQAELDRILKKVHERGVESLTLREKMFLQDMGNRFGD